MTTSVTIELNPLTTKDYGFAVAPAVDFPVIGRVVEGSIQE